MISATVAGRIGKDAVSRDAGSSKVASFTMAADQSKKGDDNKYKTDWVAVEIWGNRGQGLLPHLLKGTQVVVSGRLEMDTYVNKEGVTTAKIVVTASDIKLMGSPQAGGQPAAQKAPPPPPVAAPTKSDYDAIFSSDSEIPF